MIEEIRENEDKIMSWHYCNILGHNKLIYGRINRYSTYFCRILETELDDNGQCFFRTRGQRVAGVNR